MEEKVKISEDITKEMVEFGEALQEAFSDYNDLSYFYNGNRESRRRKGGAKYKRTRNNESPQYWR